MCWKEYPDPTLSGQILFCKPGCHAPACKTALLSVQSIFYQNDCGENPKSIEIPRKKVARSVALIILWCLMFWKLGKVYTNDSRYLIKSMANMKKFSAFFHFQGREKNLFSIQGIPLAWLLVNLYFFQMAKGQAHDTRRSLFIWYIHVFYS